MKRIYGVIIISIILAIPILMILSYEMKKAYPVDYEQLSEDERIVIRFSHVVGENTPKGMAARKFAELIKERSNGYIELQVFSNGTLYKDGEEMSALLKGDIQLIAPATSKLTDIVPEISIFDLPYAFDSLDEVHEFALGDAGKTIIERLEKHNLKVVGLWDSGFKQISNNIKPIKHPSHLEGIEMRIMPSDILSKQFYTVGAYPKRIDFNTVFDQLQKGNVDGQENTLTNITSKNIHSVQKYLTITDHGYLGYFLLFNLEFWNSLSPDIQQLLTETLEEVQEWEWKLISQLNQQALNEIKQCKCINIHYLSEEDKKEWEKAFSPVYDYYESKFGEKWLKALPKYQKND